MHPVYKTEVPLIPIVSFYIFNQQIYLIIFLDYLDGDLRLFLHKMSCIS